PRRGAPMILKLVWQFDARRSPSDPGADPTTPSHKQPPSEIVCPPAASRWGSEQSGATQWHTFQDRLMSLPRSGRRPEEEVLLAWWRGADRRILSAQSCVWRRRKCGYVGVWRAANSQPSGQGAA